MQDNKPTQQATFRHRLNQRLFSAAADIQLLELHHFVGSGEVWRASGKPQVHQSTRGITGVGGGLVDLSMQQHVI
ncbi:unnamed protein product, partial [Taenia asiatica]|uniref:Acyl-CoA dehydrogenase n=1 Tax=Taenia asiatica TaxID=60517 RepID=A0A0R3WHF7_TAEAS